MKGASRSATGLMASAAFMSCAAASHGQIYTWLAEVEHAVMDPSKGVTTQTVTLTALLEDDAPYVIFGIAEFDTLGAANADQGQITSWQILNEFAELTGDLTTTDGVSLYGTYAGQLCATFGPCNTDNPVEVFTFTWEVNETPLSAYTVDYTTVTKEALLKSGDGNDDAVFVAARIVFEADISWTVIPAPATPLILAGALFPLTRRRR